MNDVAPNAVLRTAAPKGQPYLLMGLTSNDYWLYDDSGSGSNMDVALWDPMADAPYFVIGSYAQGHYGAVSGPTAIVKSVNDPNSTLLAAPAGWNLIWTDQGSHGKHDGSIWYPVPPGPDFVSVGFVGQAGYDAPNLPSYRCVHRSQLAPTTVGNLIWNDHGSKSDRDVALYSVNGVPGIFAAQANYQPFSGQVWQFKTA